MVLISTYWVFASLASVPNNRSHLFARGGALSLPQVRAALAEHNGNGEEEEPRKRKFRGLAVDTARSVRFEEPGCFRAILDTCWRGCGGRRAVAGSWSVFEGYWVAVLPGK